MSIFEKNKHIFISLLLLFFVVFGFIIRFYQIHIPSYWIDEGHTINAIKGIYNSGIPQMVSGEVYSKHWLFYYLTYFSTLILGNNEVGYRLISVLFGVAIIPLGFYFAKKISKDSIIAALTAFLLTFSQFQIGWSRQARSYTMLQFFFLLAAYFLYKLVQKFEAKTLFYYLFFSLLCFLSHPMGVIIFPVGLIILSINYWKEIKNYNYKKLLANKNVQLASVMTLVFAILVAPELFDFILMGINKTQSVAIDYIRLILDQFLIIFSGSILGLIYLLFEDEDNFFFLTLLFLIPLSAIFFAASIVQLRYIFFLLPVVYFLFAYFLVKITSLISNNWIQVFLVIICTLTLVFNSLQFFPKTNYSIGPLTPQPNFKQAYKKIKPKLGKQDIVISPYTVISQAYLDRAGYWLKLSLTGKKSELNQYKNKQKEFYTNSTIVHNYSQLINLARNKDGFLVIDQMYLNRRNNLVSFKKNFELILHTGSGLNGLWVFKI